MCIEVSSSPVFFYGNPSTVRSNLPHNSGTHIQISANFRTMDPNIDILRLFVPFGYQHCTAAMRLDKDTTLSTWSWQVLWLLRLCDHNAFDPDVDQSDPFCGPLVLSNDSSSTTQFAQHYMSTTTESLRRLECEMSTVISFIYRMKQPESRLALAFEELNAYALPSFFYETLYGGYTEHQPK